MDVGTTAPYKIETVRDCGKYVDHPGACTVEVADTSPPEYLRPRSLAARVLPVMLLVVFATFLGLSPQAQAQTTGICGRTAEVRDGILVRISGITDCAAVTAAHLAAITGTLDLEERGITALAVGDFDGLTAVDSLSLGNNDLTTLPAGVFDSLTALEALRLTRNELTMLPAGVFDSLTVLEGLELASNDLTTLPAGVFDSLTALERLALSGNALTTLPAGVFDNLTSLEKLYLFYNDLTSLPAGVFDSLTALWYMSLSVNDVTTLPAGVFDNLTSLEVLSLGRYLTTLPAGVFDSLTALERLNLRSNDLTTLPAGVFDSLAALEELELHYNALTTLPAGVFDSLTALEELYLHNNSLTTLPAGVFDSLTALERLSLNYNDLATLPAGVFDSLTALKWLELNDNTLTALPARVFDSLTMLWYMNLSSNALTTLPAGLFDSLTALERLHLGGNPGAPFAPTADALPDDGEVSTAGGDVMLDGSGSGGAWGTNVIYSWELTAPTSGVAVTFDDNTIARPKVTIPALTVGTELTFTLTVTVRIGIFNGISRVATDVAKVTVTLPTGINTESEELPAEVTLSGNYPNPFNPETTIRYGLPKAREVRLAVYNLLGHEVAILVDEPKPAGHHTVRLGAGNLPSGVYVYRLHAGDETIVRTMMLVK